MPNPLDLSRLSQHAAADMMNKASHLLDRQVETLKLYEPMPWQERLHACRRRECLVRKGQQVGGSLSMFVELARAVTNQDPHQKYPQSGTIVVIGYGEKHIGNNIYKYLFEKGHNNLKIIRDMETGRWRMFRPWLGMKHGKQGDKGRESDAKPAPPLIPKRFYDPKKSFSWVKARQRVFSKVELATGWTILAYNSQGDPRHAMGIQATAVFIDEDLANQEWYTEMLGRTMIPASNGYGYLRWNAVPQGDNNAMMNLIDTCELQSGDEKATAEMITVTLYDNIYLDEKARDENIEKWKREGDDVFNQRVYGQLSLGEQLMYPRFHQRIHGLHSWELPGGRPELQIPGSVPLDWTRYLVIDPGVTPGSVGLFAVPPPGSEYGRMVLLYKELIIKDCTSAKLAEEVKRETQGVIFQDFLIDYHGAMSRQMASGVAVHKQYAADFERLGIVCQRRGSRFARASDDVDGRTGILRDMLWSDPQSDDDDTPAFRYVPEACPSFERQMRVYRKKTVVQGGEKIILNEPNVRGIHMPVIAEYAAAARLRYVRPPVSERRTGEVYDRIHKANQKQKRKKSVVRLS